jgi:hypothetical protein
MGMMPWDRDRLTPDEIRQLWTGFEWRQKRFAWALAGAAQIVGACLTKDAPEAKDTWGYVGFGGEDDG